MNADATPPPRPPDDVGDMLQAVSSIPRPPLSSARIPWLPVVCLGLLCAIGGGLATLLATGPWRGANPGNAGGDAPRPDCSALIRVPLDPSLAFQGAASESTAEPRNTFAIYKHTQADILKSHLVLAEALQESEVAALEVVAGQQDPAVWLVRQLRVDFRCDAELMEVSLPGVDPQQAAVLINAVVKSYLGKMDDRHRRQKQRLDDLGAVYAEKAKQVTEKRSLLRDLAGQLAAEDAAAVALKHKIALVEFAETQREYLRIQTNYRYAENELTMQRALLTGVRELNISDAEVDAFLQSDPAAGQVYFEMLDQLDKLYAEHEVLARPTADTQHTEKLQRNESLIREQIDLQRQDVRQALRNRRQVEIQREVERLDARVAVTADLVEQLDADLQQRRRVVEQTARYDAMRTELQELGESLQDVAARRDRLKVELDGPRIELVREAEVPQ